jgi:hypothetical protein
MPSPKSTDDRQNREELARRIKGAIGYGRLSRDEAADIFECSPSHADRYWRPANPYAPTLQQLWKLSDAAGLSRDWWYADLTRLPEIAPTSGPLSLPAPGAAKAASRVSGRHRKAAGDTKRSRDDSP